jgi:hypothetical protein
VVEAIPARHEIDARSGSFRMSRPTNYRFCAPWRSVLSRTRFDTTSAPTGRRNGKVRLTQALMGCPTTRPGSTARPPEA